MIMEKTINSAIEDNVSIGEPWTSRFNKIWKKISKINITRSKKIY